MSSDEEDLYDRLKALARDMSQLRAAYETACKSEAESTGELVKANLEIARLRKVMRTVAEGGQLNHCANDPACCQESEDDGELPHDEWCGVCLMAADLEAALSEGDPK